MQCLTGPLFLLVLHSAPVEALLQNGYTFRDKDFVFALEVNKSPSANDEGSLCEVKSLTVRRKSDGQELRQDGTTSLTMGRKVRGKWKKEPRQLDE